MTALAWALVGVIATQLAALLWLVYGRSADARALQSMDDERDKAVAEVARLIFELATTQTKLAEETDRANAFEEALADVEANPNSDLPRNAAGVRERVRRAAQEARASRANGVPADAADTVHPPPAASDTEAAEVHAPGSLDPEESLL